MLTAGRIRQGFIDYFVERRGHRHVPSSPVVPHDDPTLLFANAGMNQFKDVFLGVGTRDYLRAANSQKCIRAGGKHNDLEDVGKDTYHHTFFEMLGNWSFGDYFKKEAILWAWELLTDVWGIDKTRLHATVFKGDPGQHLDPDEEAAELWRSVTDINPDHIHYGDKKDNFWEMGDTGPCGPCSEVHIDLTPDRSGGPLVNADDPRVIEIWNLVFIQFNRDTAGKLSPLPAKHVDTGMGFERICAVLQGKASNYDTDVFAPIFRGIADVTGGRPYGGSDDKTDTAYRIIADHVRCLTVALTDGAVPSNEGRGYVLRRILRRAARHGRQTLGVTGPFLHELVPVVVESLGEAFPELRNNPDAVAELIRDEEVAFGKTLDRGIALFEQAAEAGGDRLAAEDAFKLHDTYGFPLDLTQVMAEERGLAVDVEGFNRLMEAARAQARAGGGSADAAAALVDAVQRDRIPDTEFTGYDGTESDAATWCLVYRLRDEAGVERVDRAEQGQRVALALGRTPFYAESGGQVGDTGSVGTDAGEVRVDDTIKVGQVHFHVGEVIRGDIESVPPDATAASVVCRVDAPSRASTMANHTGTHLLNRALRDVLGDHVQQKGSLVDPEKLRFDLSHNAPITPDEIDRVERAVNADVAADLPVYTELVPQDQARRINTLRAVFGEKYPDVVRVVSIGVPVADLLGAPDDPKWMGYSVEFCGGTHLAKTGDAEGLVVTVEEAVSKGVRRIVALTGKTAHEAAAKGDMLLARAQGIESLPGDKLADAVNELNQQIAETTLPLLAKEKLRAIVSTLQGKLKQQAKQRSRESADRVVDEARRIAESAEGDVIVAALDADAAALRTAMDVIRKKRPETAMLLGGAPSDSEGKVGFIAAVPKPLIERGLKAGDWVREVAKVAGGGGGGRPDMAQAGGKDPAKLQDALEAGRRFAEAALAVAKS